MGSSVDSISKDTEEKLPARLLIVCVDRDNDVEVKTGIKTPIVGRDNCLDAAMKLSVADPEEADANAIFAAVKEYDELLQKGEHCEVMVAGGFFERGVQGDRKIRKEIANTLSGFPADGIVLVSDGLEGEEIVPVIQTLAPIVSVRKVVIKHSKSVEESYAVLGRYFKMLLFDPRYAKYALGLPGLIFIGMVLIYVVDPGAVGLVLTVFIGIVFIIRGFDIDRRIESIGKLSATGLLKFFSALVSILIVLVGIGNGISIFFAPPSKGVPPSQPYTIQKIIATNPQQIVVYIPKIAGFFLQNAQIFIWLGIAVYITTSIFFNVLSQRPRHIMRYLVELSVLGLLYFPVSTFAQYLITPSTSNDLFIAIAMFVVAVNFSIAAYIYQYRNKRRTGRDTQAIEV